jgi:hypothetical protein
MELSTSTYNSLKRGDSGHGPPKREKSRPGHSRASRKLTSSDLTVDGQNHSINIKPSSIHLRQSSYRASVVGLNSRSSRSVSQADFLEGDEMAAAILVDLAVDLVPLSTRATGARTSDIALGRIAWLRASTKVRLLLISTKVWDATICGRKRRIAT